MGEVTIWVSPLTYEQKISLASSTKVVSGQEVIDNVSVALKSLKYSIKDVTGLTGFDGQPYELSFDADGTLTDECVSDLMQLDNAGSLATVCYKLADRIDNHEVDGVSVNLSGAVKAQKKTTE